MKALLMAVALVGMLGSGTAKAANGNELLDSCQQAIRVMDTKTSDGISPLAVGQCFGIMEGVRGVLQILESNLHKNLRVCFPVGGINNAQAARIVKKYLHDNPAQLNEDATLLTIHAFKQAYPCK